MVMKPTFTSLTISLETTAILELKYTTTRTKIIGSTAEWMMDKRIGELKHRTIVIILSEKQRENRLRRRNRTELQGPMGI